jgi:hypothetical protein
MCIIATPEGAFFGDTPGRQLTGWLRPLGKRFFRGNHRFFCHFPACEI